jgi:hypothetical protein
MSDDDLRSQWLEHCLDLAGRRSELWRGNQKILRNQRITLTLDDSLTLDDIGYTDRKAGMLEGLYVHQESHDAALDQWRERKKKFTSVPFHCFNHLTKAAGKGGTQGPCLLSVVVTDTGREVVASVHYRSIEVFKKFPADLIFLRDTLLRPFEVNGDVTFHIANVTVHPLYFPTLLPLLHDPVATLRDLKQRDERFWRFAVQEAEDLLNDGPRNANWGQGKRVGKHIRTHIEDGPLSELHDYLRS